MVLFIRKGFDATSMDDIAQSLGVTKSAVYHHVPSKDSLLAQALDEALDGLERAIDSVVAEPGSASERLRHAVRRSVKVLVAHQPEVTLLLRVHGNSAVEQEALQRRRAIDRRLADLVMAAVGEGDVRGDLDPEVVSRLLFGMVNSLVEWYRVGGTLTEESLADSVVHLAFDGLMSQPS